MLRRVLEHPTEKGGTREHCSHQLENLPVFNPNKLHINGEKEPLVDVFEDGAGVVVLAELIGIDQSAIDLHTTEDKLVISVDSAERKYDRQIELPAKVDVGSSSSCLKNGILEIRLRKLEEKLVSKIE
jgi:HSP20 family protein